MVITTFHMRNILHKTFMNQNCHSTRFSAYREFSGRGVEYAIILEVCTEVKLRTGKRFHDKKLLKRFNVANKIRFIQFCNQIVDI